MNLFAYLKQRLGSQLTHHVRGMTGLSGEAAEQVTDRVIPSMLGCIVAQGQSGAGCETLVAVFQGQAADVTELEAIDAILADEAQAGEFLDRGSHIARSFLGKREEPIVAEIAAAAGLADEEVSAILNLASPLIAAEFDRLMDQETLDVPALQTLLNQQHEFSDIDVLPSSGNENAFDDITEETSELPSGSETLSRQQTQEHERLSRYAAAIKKHRQEHPQAIHKPNPISTETPKPSPEVHHIPVNTENSPTNTPASTTEPFTPVKWLLLPLIALLLLAAWLLSTCSPYSGNEQASTPVESATVTTDENTSTEVAAETTAPTPKASASAASTSETDTGEAAAETGQSSAAPSDTESPLPQASTDATAGTQEAPASESAPGTEAEAGSAGNAATAEQTAIETAAETAAAKEMNVGSETAGTEKEIQLPGGTALKVSAGSPVDEIAGFIQKGDTAALPKAFVLRGLNFETASNQLTEDSAKILADLAATLKAYPGVKILLQGYTDNRGAPEFNKSLSAARAKAVKQTLVDAGVEAERIKTEGLGVENPIADNATAEGRRQNRRVEVVITALE